MILSNDDYCKSGYICDVLIFTIFHKSIASQNYKSPKFHLKHSPSSRKHKTVKYGGVLRNKKRFTVFVLDFLLGITCNYQNIQIFVPVLICSTIHNIKLSFCGNILYTCLPRPLKNSVYITTYSSIIYSFKIFSMGVPYSFLPSTLCSNKSSSRVNDL